MNNILHSVYLKHDTGFSSLTKQALAQIILKIIFQYGSKGINIQKIRSQLQYLTNVKFDTRDIQSALLRLKDVDEKVHEKEGRYFIKESYKEAIKRAIDESIQLHKQAMEKWFSNTETYKSNPDIINLWFQSLLISFFKNYSYDWIRDLKPRRNNGKKGNTNIESIIDRSFLNNSTIVEQDRLWLKKQFLGFLDSGDKNDNDLLWIYGTSMFSATLLTARNYADEFSLKIFQDADFILDTNILMILELEGFEHNYALKTIEDTFVKLNITPKYFKISEDEYLRTIGPKRDSTIASINKYDFEVIKELDCAFVQTALLRGCEKEEDFQQFFLEVANIPEKFHESLNLECCDFAELAEIIEEGEANNEIQDQINRLYRRRANRDKRPRAKQHDAGLFKGAEYLNKSKKTLILTRDTILREYAYESIVRDDYPLAIGLDSLIQMMAINSGGTERESTNFAPLFSKLVKSSLFPEKDIFKPEDLEFILKSRIQISELPKEKVLEIAKKVNKLRMRNLPDEDIVLEIQRSFNVTISEFTEEIESLKSDKFQAEVDKERVNKTNKALKEKLFKSNYEKEINKLQKIVKNNRIRLVGLFLLIAILFWSIFHFATDTNDYIKNSIPIAGSIVASLLINMFGFKYKIKIQEVDKINVRKKVENEITRL